jgi:release factor glutamine methyltransferase
VTLKDSLRAAIDRLESEHVPSPRLNAELLLMWVLNCDRAYLYAHPERNLSNDESIGYEQALTKRASGTPAQYITGHQEFWGMDFIVNADVLIPRPETEHLIETVLSLAKKTGTAKIADIGTGSGCIAIALAKELPQAEIHAIDISPNALEVAKANAARLQFENKIHFHQTDLLQGLPNNAFDFVVSNPPYVGESEADQVQLEVRKFEPKGAVFAGPTGMEVIERLVPQAHVALKPGGWLVFELSGTIHTQVLALLQSWTAVSITKDLQGIPRVASAQKI